MKARTHQIKPEIMSPAGYWPQLETAVEAGADAVYFGLNHFTARAKVGFTLSELPNVMQTLHQRGVKGYVTFNTLVFDHEIKSALKTVEAIAKAGADSIIVQDIGIAQMAHQIAPDLEIHGSTQMSITSAEGIALAQQFGVSRVVLARELAISEIATIRKQTECELEMFVHGALCVSYSGQCFSSEAWGGRSANRGQCAQACRLPYEMIVDDQLKPLGDARYLLSPGDLFALHQIPELVDIGIHSLKIEGRYKDENYVALTTKAYRKAVDDAWAGQQSELTEASQQLEQVYSRGLGDYFVSGVNHQKVVNGRSPRHRGLLMGRVVAVQKDRVVIKPNPQYGNIPLKAGDGVVFDAADWRSPDEREEGGRVYQVTAVAKNRLELQFGNGQIRFKRIRVGDLIWRSHDPDIGKAAKPFSQASQPVYKQPLRVHVTAHQDEPMVLKWSLINHPNVEVIVHSDDPLPEATNRAIDEAYLRKQLGRLGKTAYALTELTADIQKRPFAPSSLLNQLRRRAVEQLQAIQATPKSHEIKTSSDQLFQETVSNLQLSSPERQSLIPTPKSPNLHLLIRTPEQLEGAIEVKPDSITLDYLDLYGLRPAVERVIEAGIKVRVASPRILKPREQKIVNFLLRLNCDLVVRSGGVLSALLENDPPALIGDFSLNAANQLSAETYLEMGLQRITPTHDLNADQIKTLASQIGPDKIEVIAYHHLPVFHTEHCVFCRFLSTGTSYKNCGKPCEEHKVALRDKNGRSHPVMADIGCRNTVFGAEAQSASSYLKQWLQAGILDYRLEFVHETAVDVIKVSQAFSKALNGKMEPDALSKTLHTIAPQGITKGSLYIPDDYLTLPVLQ